MKLEDLLAHIESLELDAPPAARPAAPTLVATTQLGAASVVSGSVVVADTSVTAQQLQDVQYSTLLAQLTADKRVDRTSSPAAWYQAYWGWLSALGWEISPISSGPYTPAGTNVVIQDVALATLGQTASPTQVESMQRALQVLPSVPDAHWRWLETSRSSDKGNFQLLTCRAESGNLTTAFASFYFSAKLIGNDFLLRPYPKNDVSLHASTQKAVLDDVFYRELREKVRDKLGYRADEYIIALPL